MIRNNLESIDYIDGCKYQLILYYKEKYKKEFIQPKILWEVTIRLLKIVGPFGKIPVDKKYRRKVVLKTLNQIVSDAYIESRINWEELNELNNLIDNLNIEELENEIYKDKENCLCRICC